MKTANPSLRECVQIPAAILLMSFLGVSPASSGPLYRDASDQLGHRDPRSFTMDIAQGDIDGDGQIDLVLAIEFRPNILLLGKHDGSFAAAPSGWAPRRNRDSEDASLGDVDGDGDLDLLIVSEDDRIDTYLLNDGNGTFHEADTELPVSGVSNAAILADMDNDGDLDLLIGNNGPNTLLLNDGAGRFDLDSDFPGGQDVTQDLEMGDVNGDGWQDIVVANEGIDRLLIALGDGAFKDATEGQLVQDAPGETRDAALADVDGDGDLDLYLSNVRLFQQHDPQDRLLINDGTGRFRDETAGRLPPDSSSTMDTAFADLDGDGDLDAVLAHFGDLTGRTWAHSVRALLNDGSGHFTDATDLVFPPSAVANGMHVEVLQNPRGRPTLLVASRGGPNLLLVPDNPD